MSVVFDIGAADWGASTSIVKLADRFKPHKLHAYDANPVFGEGVWQHNETVIVQHRKAAWTYDGFIRFHGAGTRGYVNTEVEAQAGTSVPCVDLAELIKDACYEKRKHIVVKFDIEGGEHVLIPHLVASDVDKCIDLLLVERHGGTDEEWTEMLALLRCPVEEWE